MNQEEQSYRDQWLAVIDKNGVATPAALYVTAVPGVVAQITKGEPPGSLALQESPGNVLMVNLSPVQDLRQVRGQRSFVSSMLPWDMTLMPMGISSKWSWKSFCDRLDLVVLPDALGEEYKIDTIDRFLFRDGELVSICRKLCREMSLCAGADRLYLETLAIDIATLLMRRYSTRGLSEACSSKSGLAHNQACRIIEYMEANLERPITIRELASVVGLSPHHFLRMFKRTLGLTPYQYLLERRIERAKEMLRDLTASLSEIGLSTGFCNQSHFTCAFHRVVGATPAEFQRLVAAQARCGPSKAGSKMFAGHSRDGSGHPRQ